MNALRSSIRHSNISKFGQRFASTLPLPKPPIPVRNVLPTRHKERCKALQLSHHIQHLSSTREQECYLKHNFRTDYLSDPSTYPLIGIMCFATSLIFIWSANCMLNDNHDLRVFPAHKQDIIRTWGDEKEYDKLTHKLALGPIIMHEKDWRSIWQEGLGVNHEEWLKQKEASAASLKNNN